MAVEDPVVTVVRLLDKNVNLVKEDGSLARVSVTPEYYDRELSKNVDAQVTVGLDRSEDQKLGFSAILRRRVGYLKVNTWTVDRTNTSARQTRDKLRQEVNRVIREKRTKPNQTTYNYVGVGETSNTNTAHYAYSASELPPDVQEWTQLSSADYENLWRSDDSRFSFSQTEENCCSFLLFSFKIDSKPDVLKNVVLTFEGYGTAPAGNGVSIKAWNYESSTWQHAQAGTADQDETLQITLDSSFAEFVDSNGYLYLLAKTAYPSNGSVPAAVFCDYADCLVDVEGVCYVDVVSYRDQDELRVKPCIWRTEFLVKTWLFEKVMVT